MFYAGIGGAWFDNQPSQASDSCTGGGGTASRRTRTEICRAVVGYVADAAGNPILGPDGQPQLTYGPPQTISGFRLKDGRASYGLGLETFALGFPIHFDWSWRTTFSREWEDIAFAGAGAAEGKSGSQWFRTPRFAIWIGYDF